jgi:hypothetical protein
VLEIQTAFTLAVGLTINKPMTVRFTRAGKLTITDPAQSAITITSSDVLIDLGASSADRLVGPGNGPAGVAAGVQGSGTAAAPLKNLTVIGRGNIRSFNKYGVFFENCVNVSVRDIYVNDIGYGGVVFLSVLGGEVRGTHISNIVQSAGFVNSYGIGISRDSAKTLANGPHSQDIIVEGNDVRGVPLWEGLDTHDGINVQFLNNRVYGCAYGIAVVSGKDTTGATMYAPKYCVVRGNYIDSQVTDGSRTQGISVIGASNVLGTPYDWAEACTVTDNTVIGYGLDANGASAGGIAAYCTRGLTIARNKIYNPAYHGIVLYHTNKAADVTDNLIVDVWAGVTADDGTMSGICFRSTYNTARLAGNKIVSGGLVKTVVNPRGLYVANDPTNTIDVGSNDWSAATTPFTDGGGRTQATMLARSLQFGSSLTTLTASPSNGGAGALPAAPKGYLPAMVNGVLVSIPFYNNP